MTMIKCLFGFVLTYVCAINAQTSDSIEYVSTQIAIELPISLAKTELNKQLAYHKDAMFGTPFKTSPSIMGKLEFHDDLSPDKMSCVDYSAKVSKSDDDFVGSRIFVLWRGGCTFAEKVRNAQQKGAGAVIIVDSICYKGDVDKHASWAENECQDHEPETRIPYMADDRRKGHIQIPGLLVTKYAGQQLIDCLRMSEEEYSPVVLKKSDFSKVCDQHVRVIARIELNIPRPDGNVEWEIWYSSEMPPQGMYGIGKVSEALLSYSTFTPRHFFLSKKDLKCDDYCAEFCLKDYCAIGRESLKPGKDIVRENIRQHCLWEAVKGNEAKKEKSQQAIWWDFIQKYREAINANGENRVCDLECSEKLLPSKYVSQVKKCEEEELSSMNYAESMHQLASEQDVFQEALVVNTARQEFAVDPLFVSHAVCMGYAENTVPSVCTCVNTLKSESTLDTCIHAKCFENEKAPLYCSVSDKCVATENECLESTSSGVSASGVFFIVLMVGSIISCAAYAYYRRARQQMQEEVRDILSEYMPLEELGSLNSRGNGGFARAGRDDNVGVI